MAEATGRSLLSEIKTGTLKEVSELVFNLCASMNGMGASFRCDREARS